MKKLTKTKTLAVMLTIMVSFAFMPSEADAASVGKVKGLKLTCTQTTITAKWNKTRGATKYLVQIARPYKAWNKHKQVKNIAKNRKAWNKKNKFKTIKLSKKKLQVYKWCKGKTWYTTKKNTFKFKKLKKNTTYTVKVRAYKGKKKGAFSNAVKRNTLSPGNTSGGSNSVNSYSYKQLVDRIWDWNDANPMYGIIPYENKQEYEYDQDIAQANLRAIKNKYNITSSSSDEYIAGAVAEWLCDRLTYNRQGPDGRFLSGTVVNCSGYATQYQYYLMQLGVECFEVGSSYVNHAWNVVRVNNKYYYVDLVCLDTDGIMPKDFRPDNKARTQYFMTSANTYGNTSEGWSGSDILPSDNPINPTDTTYDNYTGADWYNILQRGY